MTDKAVLYARVSTEEQARSGFSLRQQAEALRAWCAARLARHEVPKALELRAALPRNDAGKLLRRELRACDP